LRLPHRASRTDHQDRGDRDEKRPHLDVRPIVASRQQARPRAC
jgi:hypothetical protein